MNGNQISTNNCQLEDTFLLDSNMAHHVTVASQGQHIFLLTFDWRIGLLNLKFG